MIGIRTKIIAFTSAMTIVIATLSCILFLMHTKRQQEQAVKKFGESLVILLAQDNEVKYALSFTQQAFLDVPLKRIQSLDREKEIAYWRISNIQSLLMEGNATWLTIDMEEVPAKKGQENENHEVLITPCIIPPLKDVFYDFSLPVFEKQTFSEESFAAQVLDEIKTNKEQKILGFVQIGISSDKLKKRINAIVLRNLIPVGLIIILGGVSITLFLTKYLVSPLQQMAKITLDMSKGDLSQTVEVYSRDEIGQLSVNFNKMTQSLKISHDELRLEIIERKRAEELLEYRVKIEKLIAAISTNFISLTPEEVDSGINRSLKLMGEFGNVDRTYVFFYSDDKEKMDNTHEWCAEGIGPQIESLKNVPVGHFPWGMEKLKRFEAIHFPRLSDMPDCAKAERELMQSQAVKSCVIVPMVYGGTLVGFLGFDSVRMEKTWTEQDINLLKIVGEIFIGAIEHRRKDKALQVLNNELEMRVEDRTATLLKTNERLEEEILGHKRAKDELRKYEILVSQMSDLAYICDRQGNILFVNPSFEKLTNHKPDEFKGKSFAPLFDEENLKIGMKYYTKTLEGESPNYEVCFKDTGVLCEYKNLPLRDNEGEIIGVIGVARDITERKRMENMLRETNQTLQTIIHSSPLAMTVLDSRGLVRMWNPSAEHIFGWTERETLGRFLPFVPEDKLGEFHALRDRVLNGESVRAELWRRKRDGSSINISLSAAPLFDSHGNIENILGIIADNTERQRMMDALRQAKDYAENLIETANVMVVGLDVMGNIQIFNKAAEEISGYKKTDILGKNWFEVLVSKERQSFTWQMFVKWQVGEQMPKTHENSIITKSGRMKYISWQNSDVLEHGKIIGMISFGIDITEQKQRMALVERIRLTSFVKDISISLAEGTILHKILYQCANAVVDYLDAAFARIWTLNEKENILELQASAGVYTHIDGSHSRIPVGKFKIGRIAQERKPHLTNSIFDDEYISDKDWAKRQGMVSFAGYPLIVEGHLVGVIAMFACKPLTEFTTRALASVSDIIALGIDRKQSEEALRLSEGKYRMLIENLPQRIFYKDKDSRYVSCNEIYARDLKIRPDEIVGKTDYEFFPKALAEKYRADDRRIMHSEKTEDIEEKYIIDGQELFVHTIKTPMRDEKGHMGGVLGMFWDITEKVAFQMESIRSRHLASVGELAASVAHEINNPITGIINCAQILINRSEKGSREHDIANRIIKEGNRIAAIVKTLLDFARAPDSKEQRGVFSVSEILSDTLVLIATQLKKEHIKLVVHIPQKLPKTIVHAQQIQQVFLNIISNARYALNEKYPQMHENKILEIRGEAIMFANDPYVKISFCDRGIGIPADILEKIMNPFFTTKPRGKGTGLGLSISQSIIHDHDGKLLIHAVEGEFTRVEVILPSV